MCNKVLVVDDMGRHFRLFSKYDIYVLSDMGYEVHFASNFKDKLDKMESNFVIQHQIDFPRFPFTFKTIKAIRQLRKVIKENDFKLLHCQSPTGGGVARIAALTCGFKPISYTPHGLHFYKGSPLINWLLFGIIEYILAFFTDCIISINDEDYNRLKKFHLRIKGNVKYIPGVGIDTNYIEIDMQNIKLFRSSLGVGSDDFIFVSVGEINKNKNHIQMIEAIAQLPDSDRKKVHYCICGLGALQSKLEKLTKERKISNQVHFLGYCNDVLNILQSADAFAIMSLREGLPKSLMEAMVVGKPIIATKIRGNVDLIDNEKNGILVEVGNINETRDAISRLINDKVMQERFSKNAKEKIKLFELNRVQEVMKNIFTETMNIYQ